MSTNQSLLRLNAQAMGALFPEGTELRVDLQNAVLNEVSKRYVKGALTAELRDQLNALNLSSVNVDVENAVQHLVDTYVTRYGDKLKHDTLSGSNSRHDRLEQVLNQIIEREVYRRFNDIVDAKVEKEMERMVENIDRKVSHQVTQRTNDEIKKRVNSAIERMIANIGDV